jgi:adenylyl cyclase-associated protein
MATSTTPPESSKPTHLQGPVQAARPEDHVLTRLVRRLEAATSRLEDIASSALEGAPAAIAAATTATSTTSTNGVPSTPSGVAVAGTATSQAATPTPSVTAPPTPAPAAAQPKEELPQSIEDFDALVNGDLKAYHELSKAPSIGGLLGEQVCCG